MDNLQNLSVNGMVAVPKSRTFALLEADAVLLEHSTADRT
jgi:hypothetical protein